MRFDHAPEHLRSLLMLERELRSPSPRFDRRQLLRLAMASASSILLPGCSISDREAAQSLLQKISRFNDKAQATLFSPARRATEYSPAEVTRPFRFNAFYSAASVPEIDEATWRLKVDGRVRTPRDWTVEEIKALPATTEITRLVCIEGWSAVGQWTGVTLRYFLSHIGADLGAAYVVFHCADGYYTSIDMASAVHPQTLLAFGFAGQHSLPDEFGFPLRLRIPIKLGFKNPKHIIGIKVTNSFSGGFWEDLHGYNWFGGL